MPFNTALLLLGGVLLLLGLIGKVEIQNLRIGTESSVARAISSLLGVALLAFALVENVGVLGGLWVSEPSTSSQERGGGILYVVVNSTTSRPEAIQVATNLMDKGYNAAVFETQSGYLAVTVRAPDNTSAQDFRTRLIDNDLAEDDAFVSWGKSFTKLLFPSQQTEAVAGKK